MPRILKKEITNARTLLASADAILIVTGAGMSVDSGIPTYRGSGGLWTRSIVIGDETFSYDEISSLDMWKTRPELAWGFKSHFYHLMNSCEVHQGYFELLASIDARYDYFVATSNIDGYFKKAGFDPSRIYEVHGSVNYLQCMDKKCNIQNGISPAEVLPSYNPDTFIADWLPQCKFCKNMSRPNVSMFGDVEFYGKPYEYQRKKMNDWLANLRKYNKKLAILEIGCGINPHSLRMSDGKMMSGEWKMPIFDNNIGTIRLNPNDEQDDKDTIHISLGAKQGIHLLFS